MIFALLSKTGLKRLDRLLFAEKIMITQCAVEIYIDVTFVNYAEFNAFSDDRNELEMASSVLIRLRN